MTKTYNVQTLSSFETTYRTVIFIIVFWTFATFVTLQKVHLIKVQLCIFCTCDGNVHGCFDTCVKERRYKWPKQCYTKWIHISFLTFSFFLFLIYMRYKEKKHCLSKNYLCLIGGNTSKDNMRCFAKNIRSTLKGQKDKCKKNVI